MIFNIVNGRPKVGTINVTTLAGATVTCALSPYTLSATANSSGAASFVVPKTGTWAITAKSGSSTKTGNVSVTTVGSTQSISLPFRTDLYMDGTQNVPWTYNENVSMLSKFILMVTPGGGGSTDDTRVYTTSPIDLTGYSTLNVQYESTSDFTNSSGQGFGYSSTATGTVTATPFLSNQSPKVTKTFDISSVTGAKYITLYETFRGSTPMLYIYQVYLT